MGYGTGSVNVGVGWVGRDVWWLGCWLDGNGRVGMGC